VAEADTKTGTVAEEAKADTMVEIRLDDAKDSVSTNVSNIVIEFEIKTITIKSNILS